MKQLRALTFDLDDTLWDNRRVIEAAEQALHEWLQRHYPKIARRYAPEEMRKLRGELLQQDPSLRHRLSELRKAALRAAADSAGYDREMAEPAFAVFLEARHRVVLYRDVKPALVELRRAGYCLGTLTNGNADVARLGLEDLFDFSLSAETTGQAKPHPRMFAAACSLAGVEPRELAHIGDEAATDLAGAMNAGVTTIWMNRYGAPAEPGVEYHAEVRSMADLLALLELA